ncbi:hypothetical protein GGC64_001780 [Mycobacterium sp. OAS707]|nr:hypothetical protein [Mycobacterium sp. OAS707]
MVQGVCDDDPRPIGERRSDAVGAIAAGSFRLACQRGSQTCPAGDAPISSNVVIQVLAEQSAVDAATGSAEQAAVTPPAALIVGEGIVPTPFLSQLIRGGAKVRPITTPADEPEPHYRPSAELAEFVRMRDLYCRAARLRRAGRSLRPRPHHPVSGRAHPRVKHQVSVSNQPS